MVLNEIHIYKYRCVSFATITGFQMITNCFAVILCWPKRQTGVSSKEFDGFFFVCAVNGQSGPLSRVVPYVKIWNKIAYDLTNQMFPFPANNNCITNCRMEIVRLWIHQPTLYCECGSWRPEPTTGPDGSAKYTRSGKCSNVASANFHRMNALICASVDRCVSMKVSLPCTLDTHRSTDVSVRKLQWDRNHRWSSYYRKRGVALKL